MFYIMACVDNGQMQINLQNPCVLNLEHTCGGWWEGKNRMSVHGKQNPLFCGAANGSVMESAIFGVEFSVACACLEWIVDLRNKLGCLGICPEPVSCA